MSDRTINPLGTIESTMEVLTLIQEGIAEALQDVRNDLDNATAEGQKRRVEALTLVLYKLDGLSRNMGSSHRILNDLRTLRRLLLNERDHGG